MPISLANEVFDKNVEMAKNVIKLYKDEIFNEFSRSINLDILDSTELAAGADIRASKIIITSKTFQFFEGKEILSVVCHEMGHFLGNKLLSPIKSTAALEGEADYFSGKCIVRYLIDVLGYQQENAINAALQLSQDQARRNLNSNNLLATTAKNDVYSEGKINQDYPSDDCRLLTVHHGIQDLPRPRCWYNP